MSKILQPGRPFDEDKHAQQKMKLLEAAKTLLAQKSYRKVTIREIAEQAKVNSAMISYYFNNKEGLFIALVDHLSEDLFKNLQYIRSVDNPIRAFIEMMIKMLSANNGFARLIHDEVMNGDSELKDITIERFPKKMANILPHLIINNTDVKDPQKAKYVAFSLMMMIITPFIHEPVRKHAWGISDQEIQSPIWTEHLYNLFINGCTKETGPC